MAHFMHSLDRVLAEPKSEVQEEQIPEVFKGPPGPSFMDTNILSEQGKPRCISPMILYFSFKSIFLC
jgi:hypothetical protein